MYICTEVQKMHIADYIDADLFDKFEFYNYNHAVEIITQAFPDEWNEVVDSLRKLNITTDDLREAGGNETKYDSEGLRYSLCNSLCGELLELLIEQLGLIEIDSQYSMRSLRWITGFVKETIVHDTVSLWELSVPLRRGFPMRKFLICKSPINFVSFLETIEQRGKYDFRLPGLPRHLI